MSITRPNTLILYFTVYLIPTLLLLKKKGRATETDSESASKNESIKKNLFFYIDLIKNLLFII